MRRAAVISVVIRFRLYRVSSISSVCATDRGSHVSACLLSSSCFYFLKILPVHLVLGFEMIHRPSYPVIGSLREEGSLKPPAGVRTVVGQVLSSTVK